MSAQVDEHTLAEQLCGELLTIPELRQLCQARGFPMVGNGKEEQARSAAARLLDARGIGEVMTKLDPAWLKLLHLAKARRAPVAMDAMIRIADPDAEAIWRYDYRAFFRSLVANLLVKGVALVNEGLSPSRSNSRYARFQLVFPAPFQSALPFYPIAAEPLGNGYTPSSGDLDELLEGSFRAFTENRSQSRQPKPSTLAEMLAAEFKLDDGLLTLCSSSQPTPEGIAKTVLRIWQKSLPSRSTDTASDAGSVVGHILGSLPNGMGCTAAQLEAELEFLGLSCKPEAVAAFCEQGAAAGLLLRKDRGRADPLYCATSPQPVPSRTKLKLVNRNGRCTVASPVAVLPLLQIAAVARSEIIEGALYFEPDPIRMGRRWHEMPQELAAELRSTSAPFEQAAKRIEERAGQVIVHRCLGVLRVEDAGLRAALCQRFADEVRVLEREYIACQLTTLPTLVAYAKKEGFVARRVP